MAYCCVSDDLSEPYAEIEVQQQDPIGRKSLISQAEPEQAQNAMEFPNLRTALMPLPEEGEYQGELLLHFHSAKLKEHPFAKFECSSCQAAVRSSFAIVSVQGEEITRTGLSTEVDGRSVWDCTYRHKSDNLPKEMSVSVWTSSLLGRNVLCGSVTVPCYSDMNDLNEVDFILTKSSKPTGTLRMTLQLRDIRDRSEDTWTEPASDYMTCHSPPCHSHQSKYSRQDSYLSNLSKASAASSVSVGMELDHLLACTEGRNWLNAAVSLKEPRGGFEEANLKLTKQLGEELSTATWEVKTDAGWMPWGPGVHFRGVAGEEVSFTLGRYTYKARFDNSCSGIQINLATGKRRELRTLPQIVNLDDCSDTSGTSSRQLGSEPSELNFQEESTVVNHVRSSTLQRGVSRELNRGDSRNAFIDTSEWLPLRVLLGSWKCVDTTGLEDFLKKTGVNVFQRKIAAAARWPAWEFVATDDSGVLRFINHSAVGDLKEDMLLNGQEYTIKDGHGNVLVCSSTWEPTKDGGILRTTRSGPMGCYTEERLVQGDRLNFVLSRGEDGPSWGRSFVRLKRR